MNDNTKIQLLAIDLDGTTLRNDASLSSNVKKALEYATISLPLLVPHAVIPIAIAQTANNAVAFFTNFILNLL